MEEDDENIINASDKGLWNAMSLSFIKEKLTDNITHLDLSSNHISVESAQIIAGFLSKKDSHLQGLALVNSHLSTRASKIIFEAVGSSKLYEFYADNNILVQEACEVFGKALKNGPPLEVLSLCGCQIPSEGGIAIAESLPSLKNLMHLRLESNSFFDFGAQAIAKVLKDTKIQSLNIADNEIWLEGTNELLEAVANSKFMKSLDISYNILDLDNLAKCVLANTNITELAISGAKIPILQLSSFLEKMVNSNLQILIMDGFDPNQLPVAWARIQDTIFKQPEYFDLLQNLILNSKTLVDVRVGYLELDQIATMQETFAHLKREISVSVHDFGRTGNCWVFNYPEFTVLSPTKLFKWGEPILNPNSAFQIGNIFSSAKVDGEMLNSIDVSGCQMTDECMNQMLSVLRRLDLDILDISNNNFGDEVIEQLISMAGSCKVRDFHCEKNKITDIGLELFLAFFAKELPENCPKELSFTVISEDKSPYSVHPVFQTLAEIVKQGCDIESLCIDGQITSFDVKTVVDEFPVNPVIHELSVETEMMKDYSSPDPPIDETITRGFIDLYTSLHKLICETEGSVLRDFKFPLLTEIFLYCDATGVKLWREINAKLEENFNKYKESLNNNK
ncbi:Leucine Rich Repeat family protein [Trichomonas vaginalis G3]|uniref:Leucine Rich Repeat family protein n=1 Tax=Trichomonas vaginalis (strain ATCC PRA-98 / G3) TaxID=412133 RepID=A2FAS4_TRIV3|nr:uncharacterized protein TVAGG3_0570810 [Trichomonas vaginalis G3]EAX98003.1 Leucine Rich Repeat family protein [Trichomonas vaginalis G3]KAI5521890.1 GTPase activator protein [Trichomonas vaginalis G3]|eukprot:XP_001310933.1 hypothetical protein [Trichomonas vaginalis G3]